MYENCFRSLAAAGVIHPLIPSHCTSSARAVSLLSVSQLVNREASETLYGKHTFILAQFHRRESCNEAITAWLAQIGPSNVLRLRMLKIDLSLGIWMLAHWGGAQGIVASSIQSQLPSYHAALTRSASPFYGSLFTMFHRYELATLHQIEHCLALIEPNHDFIDLHLNLPGDNAGNLDGQVMELNEKDGFFFSRETFATHGELRVAMKKLRNVQNLRVRHTSDLELFESMARAIGVRRLRTVLDHHVDNAEYEIIKTHGWGIEDDLLKGYEHGDDYGGLEIFKHLKY